MRSPTRPLIPVSRIAYSVILFTLWCRPGGSAEPTPVASVTVVAVDSFGTSFGKVDVLLFKDDRGRDYVSHFAGSIGRGIPFGEYMIRIQTASGGLITQRIVVYRWDCMLVLARNPVTVDFATGKAPVLSGRISLRPGEGSSIVWVKLCGLYIDGCEVSEVGKDGSFSFINPTPGSYTISVLAATGELMTERVDIRNPRSVLLLYPGRSGRERVEVSDQM